ncbi:MAG: shikimate kinase [Actinomycetota bacterium]|nr:shikimate kinase [Actinomycetota bacterium]
MSHLVLVGMMGVGKTTVGRIASNRLDRPLIDSDQVIEQRTGRTVREIFEADGEPAFRAVETEVLLEALAGAEPSVIVAAGGVVLDPSNRKAINDADARVVWLVAEPVTLVERVERGGHRPLLDRDPTATLERMWEERQPLYREVADAIVSVENRSLHEVVEAVLR